MPSWHWDTAVRTIGLTPILRGLYLESYMMNKQINVEIFSVNVRDIRKSKLDGVVKMNWERN